MECSDDEAAEEENFFSLERFSRARVRWTGAEPMDGVLQAFPGFPFLRGHEVEESINTEGPPSFHPKRIFFQWVCGQRQCRGLRF